MALLSDNSDILESYFRIETGNDGDYYPQISYIDEDNYIHTISIRIAMSGGNAPTEVKLAIANLYKALENNNLNKRLIDDKESGLWE